MGRKCLAMGILKDFSKRSAQNDMENYSHVIEMVPIDVIKQFSHVDRRAPDMSHYTDDDWQELRKSLEQGWTAPLLITYFKADNTAVLSEGNHRLSEAEAMGLTEVPVRVIRYSMPGSESSFADSVKPVPGHPDAPDGYVPADLRPSDIGIA